MHYTGLQQIVQHPASVDAYIRAGFSLVPIPYASKAPVTPKWSLRENALKSQAELPAGWGVGLAHAYSGTMALDIDDYDIARFLLAEHGVDIDALFQDPDAVTIESGRAGHGKLLYAMPFGLVLPSKQIYGPMGAAYNFRCASSTGTTAQDVLPPSIHPSGHPYQWGGRGHWSRLPLLPDALLEVWQSLLAVDRQRTIKASGAPDASWDDVRLALLCLSPDMSRDDWIRVGMALQWAGEQTGQLEHARQLWDDWSAQSTKYPGSHGLESQWRSLRADKPTAVVTMGTFWRMARQAGYRPAAPDVSALFSAQPAPVVILDDMVPVPPAVDLDLFPEVLATRAREVSDAVGCDPLVPLWSGLGAVCAAVDARSRLVLAPGFKVPPVLWLMTIGDPADKKTPGSRPMMSVLHDIEMDDKPLAAKRLMEYSVKENIYLNAKKAFIEWSSSPEAMIPGTQGPAVPEIPVQQPALKLTVTDITSQKLVRNAVTTPQGMLCYLDEMAAWVKKMTDRMSGEDRSAWVVSYESAPYDMDRVGGGAMHCDNLAVSIYGNIQPRVLKESLSSLANDGLLQRFIPAILNPENTRLGNPVPEEFTTKAKWEQTIRTLNALPITEYHLSPDAYKAYRKFQEWYEKVKQEERLAKSGDLFMTAFGKIEGLVGRLVLVFHMIEHPFTPVVETAMVNRVVALAKDYIIPAFRYVFCSPASDSLYRWVKDYILQNCDRQLISMSDIKKSGRVQFEGLNPWQQTTTVLLAMAPLEEARWVMRTDDGEREHQHKAEWLINPQLREKFKEERRKIVAAKQAVQDRIQRTATVKRKVNGYDDAMSE